MENQNHISIDNFGFHDIEGLSKLSEAEFIAQYTDQRQHGVSQADWLLWMKGAYKSIIAVSTVDKKFNRSKVKKGLEQ